MLAYSHVPVLEVQENREQCSNYVLLSILRLLAMLQRLKHDEIDYLLLKRPFLQGFETIAAAPVPWLLLQEGAS